MYYGADFIVKKDYHDTMSEKTDKKTTEDRPFSGIRSPLPWSYGDQKLLLHVCCAPCSGEIIEAILVSNIDLTLFFYNPNIYPLAEYERRKAEVIRFALKKGIDVVDADYDPDSWFVRIQGLEDEPERGRRCTVCFDMRLQRTASYASESGFSVMATSLGISRWKDMDQVNAAGQRAADAYPAVTYWNYNWRKNGGSQRMHEIRKREDFYQQDYCGCVFSLRDSEMRQQAKETAGTKHGQQTESRGVT